MYKWEILSKHNSELDLIDQILVSRDITGEEKDIFLNPPNFNYWLKKLPKDFLTNLAKSKNLIKNSIKENIPIIIHGDYDVDGICATAILYKCIKHELNYENVYAFIPNRFEHGYGLSKDSVHASIDSIDKDQKILFVTVDSGITSVDEVSYIKDLGHDIIITDHHQKPEELPNADAILWYDQIVGASISWFLARALGAKNTDLLALAGLATVTDLQPLLNLNRTIVIEALKILNNKPPLGISALLKVSGRKENEVTTYDLGWVIGPRLNASGRLEDAKLSLDLLIETDLGKVENIANELNSVNINRQDKTLEMYELASFSEQEEVPKIIISSNANYHEGIIGLVASKLVQKYYRPAIVINTSEDLAKGSVRSITGINIIEILRKFDDLFESLGGHPMAAGFSIKKDKIKNLETSLEKYFDKHIEEELFEKRLFIDLQVDSDVINLETVEELKKLEPFGLGNNKPVFCIEKLGISKIDKIGKQSDHLLIRLFGGDNFFKAIYFSGAELYDLYNVGDMVDIAFYMQENEFNGIKSVDLILKDIRHSSD